ncbi:hypothetical protein TRFO_24617 [Tritrichomonas foetus]|uniref:Actin family protein n=1 Tax=Tritrichomonas foetus TaxID=1144522 RepID=A0A1J4K7B8_9EUKA|nr:hypothetical protein TRFO_24617 [Tritrichomonas foetus]|eukprot:OHT07279.1 hypothetical protein TRFO_24617 [Tritrichomonas foetus]
MSAVPQVVIDIGVSDIRAGVNGDKKPTIIIPYENEGVVVDGEIKNFPIFEKYIEQVYQQLKIETLNSSLLVSLSTLNSLQNKIELCDLLFNKFKVGNLFIGNQSVMVSYAYGQMTSIIIITDTINNNLTILPVFDGYAQLKHIIQLNYSNIQEELLNQRFNEFVENVTKGLNVDPSKKEYLSKHVVLEGNNHSFIQNIRSKISESQPFETIDNLSTEPNASFIGGSILTSLQDFLPMRLSSSEYSSNPKEEILRKKFFLL